MWNTHYSNRRCNELEKIKEHKMHLERIVTVKTMLDMKEPKKPRFLVERSKKEKMEEENKKKIFYENNVLLGKIIDIEKKPSQYNPYLLVPARCPAYDKTTFQIKKKKFEIDKENLVRIVLN
jgi:hypothetical protein